ncbi:hypothetical protein HPULCUR_008179 [Helicostylum pulchrum]|uniref:Uncharacterized protein n=1 Tax=Helicostylum pulchrum TaxID=562976 RepID=A0ABP9Y7K8_9FUNG
MNGFNSINPNFENGGLSKKYSNGNAHSNHNVGSSLATDWQRGCTHNLDGSNKLEIIYSAPKGSHYGNDTNGIADHPLQQQQQHGGKIDNGSIADNAGNYHGRSNNTWMVEMREEAPVFTRKKKNYHTEQISCNLNDLVLGLKSPIIQLAVSKMEEEGSQCNSRPSSASSSSPIPFEFIVDEQKKLAKSYNTGAKEFIPTFSKWNP